VNAESAERALIGAALLSPEVAADLPAAAPEEAFTDLLCRAAWRAINDAVAASTATDLVAIATRIAARGKGPLANPHTALFEMQSGATASSYEWYLGLVVEAWNQRRATAAAQRFMQHIAEADNVAEVIEHHRTVLDEITVSVDSASTADQLLTEVLTIAEDGQDAALIRLPWGDLNRIVTLRAGNLIVIGARPSVGKSVMCTQIAASTASTGARVGLFSLEMTKVEIGQRLLAGRARVELDSIIKGLCTEDDWKRISRVSADVAALTLTIDDKAATNLTDIRSFARRHKPKLIVVDYLQLLSGPKTESRQNDVAAVSRGLKQIAKDYECVVVAAAQLNRGLESRHSKLPTLSDLRESGQIEQDADIVMLLHREDMYERESPRAGELDVLVPKNRSGANGITVTLGFDGKRSRIVQLAPEYQSV
jgi:replicative DNA helicase